MTTSNLDRPWHINYVSPLDNEWHCVHFENQEDTTHMAILFENQKIRFLTYKRIEHPIHTHCSESYSMKRGQFGRGLFKD